jgi:hypothetical protein
MAGPERVTWEIVTVTSTGSCKLLVVHPRGTIVEYFATTADALKREQELEAMFLNAALSLPHTAWAS